MKEDKEIHIIRQLLQRWYAGTATPKESAELYSLFGKVTDLPEDLETDRMLINSFAIEDQGNDNLPEMPTQYQSRIAEAIEREIAQTDVKSIPIGFWARLVDSRRKWWTIAGCIICILSIGLALRFLIPYNAVEDKESHFANLRGTPGQYNKIEELQDTLSLIPIEKTVSGVQDAVAESSASPDKIIRRNNESARRKVLETESFRTEPEEYFPEGTCDQLAYLSAAEEEMLARSNYRIIRDPAEADEILSSIFGRMESNVEMESCRLSRIELEYDSEMVKFANFENNITNNNEYHEEDPI